MKYRNIKSGVIVDVPSKLGGKLWERIDAKEPAKAPSVVPEKPAAKKDTVEKKPAKKTSTRKTTKKS